ncbi:hypothetical protein Vafri_9218 [Volvox africanus]|uniref:Uncharacterized protein n=1 Tax=Volvox africanus TaxID=51714 RepID=A0A8J4F190_9CHLO|nr:hypothetical protein Vafri_9218 [Volvox africanus]
MPRVELKCRDKKCLLLGGHRIATNAIMVWCTCPQPDNAHLDGSRLMALDAWVIEHCRGEKLDDYEEEEEDEEEDAPGRVDALCMEEAMVVRAGRNLLPKQVSFKQFLSSTLVAQGGTKALKGTSVWVYWYDQPIPTPNCPEYGGMYRTWAPGSLARQGLGVWYRAKIMRCDTCTGVVQIKYDIDASTDAMYLLVAFVHFGAEAPVRGTKPEVLLDMDLVQSLGLPRSAVVSAGAAKGKDRSAATAATAGASKKATAPAATAAAAAAVRKPAIATAAAAAVRKAPLVAAAETKHVAAAKPASAAAAAPAKKSHPSASPKSPAVKQPAKPEHDKPHKGLNENKKSAREAIKTTAAAAAPSPSPIARSQQPQTAGTAAAPSPSGPKPPHNNPSKAPMGYVSSMKAPQTPSKRPASSPPPAPPKSSRPAPMGSGAAAGDAVRMDPAAKKFRLAEIQQQSTKEQKPEAPRMLASRRDSPAQPAAGAAAVAEVVAMPGSAPRLTKRPRHEFDSVALAGGINHIPPSPPLPAVNRCNRVRPRQGQFPLAAASPGSIDLGRMGGTVSEQPTGWRFHRLVVRRKGAGPTAGVQHG